MASLKKIALLLLLGIFGRLGKAQEQPNIGFISPDVVSDIGKFEMTFFACLFFNKCP